MRGEHRNVLFLCLLFVFAYKFIHLRVLIYIDCVVIIIKDLNTMNILVIINYFLACTYQVLHKSIYF